MDTGIKVVSRDTLITICGIIGVLSAIAYGSLVSWMYIFLPKQKDDLKGKRKNATIISAVLFFLTIMTGGFVGYSLVFGPPPLVVLIIIFLIGLISSIYQGVKLHFLQRASVETYQLLDRLEKAKNNKFRAVDGVEKE